MTGYVRICKDELKVREYELYRGLYCTLCKTLGREYGQLSRLILSYDVTFLVLVLLAVQNIVPSFEKGRCPFNLTKRCNYCTNCEDQYSYAAAVSIVLFYFKVKDNIADGSFFRRFAMHLIYPYAKRKFRKATKKYPEIIMEISVLMNDQTEVEKSGTDSLDDAADASAKSLGKLFEFTVCENEELYHFGYSLGRWVYLTDAADDIEKDIKHKSFNVFVNKYNLKSMDDYTPEIRKEVEQSLNLSIAPAVQYCKVFGNSFLLPIIENVVYEGSEAVMKKIFTPKENL